MLRRLSRELLSLPFALLPRIRMETYVSPNVMISSRETDLCAGELLLLIGFGCGMGAAVSNKVCSETIISLLELWL